MATSTMVRVRYLFPNHDVILVVTIVGVPQFTCGQDNIEIEVVRNIRLFDKIWRYELASQNGTALKKLIG